MLKTLPHKYPSILPFTRPDRACPPDYKVRGVWQRSHTNRGTIKVTLCQNRNDCCDVALILFRMSVLWRNPQTHTHTHRHSTRERAVDFSENVFFCVCVCLYWLPPSQQIEWNKTWAGVRLRGGSFCHSATPPHKDVHLVFVHVCVRLL